MESIHECPICLELYSETRKPLVLPCGHTSCSVCLNQCRKGSAVVCAHCRIAHSVNLATLPVNYLLIASEVPVVSWTSVEKLAQVGEALSQAESSFREEFVRASEQIDSTWSEKLKRITHLEELLASLKQEWFQIVQTAKAHNEQQQTEALPYFKEEGIKAAALLKELKQAYDGNAPISADTRLVLSALVNKPLKQYSLQTCLPLESNHELLSNFPDSHWGSISLEAHRTLEQMRQLEAERLLAQQAAEEAAKKAAEAAMKEEAKRAPRQNNAMKRSARQQVETDWMTVERTGDLQYLSPYMANAINAGIERGETVLEIPNEKPHLQGFRVYVTQLMMYTINKKDKEVKAKQLVRRGEAG